FFGIWEAVERYRRHEGVELRLAHSRMPGEVEKAVFGKQYIACRAACKRITRFFEGALESLRSVRPNPKGGNPLLAFRVNGLRRLAVLTVRPVSAHFRHLGGL